MLSPVPFRRFYGKEVTLVLASTTITGILREVTPDLVVVETGFEGGSETQYVFLSQVLAIKVMNKED